MILAAVVLMYRVASAERRPALVWGFATFLLCLGSLLIPLPLLRIALATAVSYAFMLVFNLMEAGRKSTIQS